MKCQCSGLPHKQWPIAYTTNLDSKYGVARINFCPKYFVTKTLDDVMSFADKSFPVNIYANIDTYMTNQAVTWFHELLHIDWASGASKRIIDIKIGFTYSEKGKQVFRIISAYGAQPCKGLARYAENTGLWVIRNAESMAIYALAKFVQKKLGDVYPHLPLAPLPPTSVSGKGVGSDYFVADDLFTILANGSFELPVNTTLDDDLEWSLSMGVCAMAEDEHGDADPSDILTLSADFALQTDYPTDYLSSWSSWAGLTPTTTTAATPTSTPAPLPTWIMNIYSDTDCTGDYYSLEGHMYDSVQPHECI
ncbi:hypothetical protein VE02_05307, partial [Pseudogymnoascus sp. 03VT05]